MDKNIEIKISINFILNLKLEIKILLKLTKTLTQRCCSSEQNETKLNTFTRSLRP